MQTLPLPDKTDFERYQELQRKLNELIAAQRYNSWEFTSLWQELENVKNRHGGMPPKEGE